MPDSLTKAARSTGPYAKGKTEMRPPRWASRFRTRTVTSPLALALEPRFMVDAAGVATGGEAAAQEVADQQTDNPQVDALADATGADVAAPNDDTVSSGNSAAGGCILNRGALTVTGSTFSGNVAFGYGGGSTTPAPRQC